MQFKVNATSTMAIILTILTVNVTVILTRIIPKAGAVTAGITEIYVILSLYHHQLESIIIVLKTVSGLSDIESIPHFIKNLAISG